MKKFYVLVLMLAMVPALFAGTVKSVKGKVDVMVGSKWTKATKGMYIKNGTKIMTGLNSSIKVQTKTGYFQVRELSMVTYKDKGTGHQQTIALKSGKVKVRYKKISGIKTSFKVQTPKGTASVRGTEELVSFSPIAGMTVIVYVGHVDIVDGAGNKIATYEGETGGVLTPGEMRTGGERMRRIIRAGRFNQDDMRIINNIIRRRFGIGLDDICDKFGEPERL